jgi:hypothetical protein
MTRSLRAVAKEDPDTKRTDQYPKVTIRKSPVYWLQNVSSATAGTCILPLTQIIGLVSLFQTLRIHGNRVMTEDKVV